MSFVLALFEKPVKFLQDEGAEIQAQNRIAPDAEARISRHFVATYARQPPKLVISRWSLHRIGSASTPSVSSPLRRLTFPMLRPGGSFSKMDASPSGGTGVKNSGSIKAAQAELKAAGGNVYALAVNNTGVIRATGIAQRNGRIILSADGGVVQNSGKLTARNAPGSGGRVKMSSGKAGTTINKGSIVASADNLKTNGGTVELTGDTVTVGSTSEIDVSGLNAGIVAIGVSAEIANEATATGGIATLAVGPDARAARQTTIEANSRILANSTSAGSGGRVVVWSEKQSVVGGVIEAKGGDLGGNGGLVETSGRTGLTIIPGTKVITAASKGLAGTWLLDPAGITIDAGPTDTSGGNPPFDQNAAMNHVRASDIVAALGTGNVTVATSNAFAAANRDIVVAAPILIPVALPSATTLILDSAGGIAINSSIGGALSNVIFQIQSHGDITVASGATVQMNGISVFAITGNITIADKLTALSNKNIFLNAPTGSIGFIGSGQASASSSATVFLDTHSTSSGTITGPSGSNAVVAGKLDITSGRQGIGTSASPLTTSVSNLEASVASNSQTTGGGIFIKNSGTTLHIGGVDPTLNGVQVSNLPGFGGIEITNIAGDLLLDSATAERITAPGNIKLTTSNSFDIQVLNASPNSLRSANGSVTLNAGGNVFIGDAATLGVNVRGQTSVTVTAGGNVSVSGSLLKAGGGTGLTVNAGGDINILTSGGFAATIGTSGGTDVNLTTGTGKTFNNSTLANGGVKTTLADDITGTVSAGGRIVVNSDYVVINSPVNAGPGSDVGFIAVTSARAFDLGTKNVGKLSFSAAELKLITANTLTIGTYFGSGNLTVSENVIQPLPFKNLLLGTRGAILINSEISLPGGAVTLNSFGSPSGILGSGALTSATLALTATGGPINLSGSLTTFVLTATATSAIDISSTSNHIAQINGISRGGDFTLRNTESLVIAGIVGGSLASDVTMRTVGHITMSGSGQIQASAGHVVTLEAANGYFINRVGSAAIQLSTGARFRIYSKDDGHPFEAGGLDRAGVAKAFAYYPNDTRAPASVFYFGGAATSTVPTTPNVSSSPAGVVALGQSSVPTRSREELNTLIAAANRALDRENVEALRGLPDISELYQELAYYTALDKQQERDAYEQRAYRWPPTGTVQVTSAEIVAGWAANGDPQYDKKLYYKLRETLLPNAISKKGIELLWGKDRIDHLNGISLKMEAMYADQVASGARTSEINPNDDDSRITGEIEQHKGYTPQRSTGALIMMENSLVFTSYKALKQYLADRGVSVVAETPRVTSGAVNGRKAYFLFVGDGSPLGKPLPPPPAPVTNPVAASPSITITSPSSEGSGPTYRFDEPK